MEDRHSIILSKCLSIDLEVDPSKAKVFGIAALRADDQPALKASGTVTEEILDKLEAALDEATFPLGHNFIAHDVQQLIALRPRLANILPRVLDTLWLNPLAFPKNPYHHLVKHYHDGRLAVGHVNDPCLLYTPDGADELLV